MPIPCPIRAFYFKDTIIAVQNLKDITNLKPAPIRVCKMNGFYGYEISTFNIAGFCFARVFARVKQTLTYLIGYLI